MKFKKSVLTLSLLCLFACKNNSNKIVWTHFEEDLDMLHGNVKQVTIKFDHPLAKAFYYVFNIDRDGKERGLHVHLGDTHFKTRYITEYDSNSDTEDLIGYTKDISGVKKYKLGGSETKAGIYKYNDQGRIIEFVKIGGVDDGNKYIYKYNNLGDLIECYEYDNAQFDSKTTFKYDKRHLIIESLAEFKGDSEVERISYQYKNFDAMNNWLTKVINSDDGKSTTVTRKITYY